MDGVERGREGKEHWQAASLKQVLGSFPGCNFEPGCLSAIAGGNAAKRIVLDTTHSQPQAFSPTLLYLQVTDHWCLRP